MTSQLGGMDSEEGTHQETRSVTNYLIHDLTLSVSGLWGFCQGLQHFLKADEVMESFAYLPGDQHSH